MTTGNHVEVEERLCSERQEKEGLGWLSGLFRRKKKRSSKQHDDDDDDDNEHDISEDSRLTRRHKGRNLHLFLSEIMRKLKHEIRKEKQRLLGKKKKMENSFQKSLSTKDHFFLERMTSVSRKSFGQDQYDKMHLSEMFSNQRRRRRIPEYSSSYSCPVRIWDHNSPLLLRSSSDDFINSETIADDSSAIKDLDSAEGSSSFISKSNQFVDDEIPKVEAYDGEILEETQSHLSVASPSQPLFTENEINPATAEAKIQPVYNQLQGKNRPMDDKESVFKYVKAVLEAVDSNREELYLKTEFSDQLLYPALISNIPFYPNQICVDHELLFDCINEVLFEYCRFPPWVSFARPRTQVLAFDVESIVSEVQEKVYCHILPMQSFRSLDEIFSEDMAKDRRWLDSRCDLESIGFETSELILNELVAELIIDL